MREKIFRFQDVLPATTPMEFARSALKKARAVRSDLRTLSLGDPMSPVDEPKAAAKVGPLDMGGLRGWQGRWVADCPAPSCHGAEYVDDTFPVFMCCSCWNRMYNHQWLRVEFPAGKEEGEKLLLERPGRNRYWNPGETVEDLRRENVEAGRGDEEPEEGGRS